MLLGVTTIEIVLLLLVFGGPALMILAFVVLAPIMGVLEVQTRRRAAKCRRRGSHLGAKVSREQQSGTHIDTMGTGTSEAPTYTTVEVCDYCGELYSSI